jgi:hypothetical protein
MPKKQSRKAKPAKDRTAEFIEHLRQYYDHDRFDFKKFPQDIPQRFPLTLGPKRIGSAFVDWKEIVVKLLATFVMQTKPAELTDDEHIERVREWYFAASPAVRIAALQPIYSMIFHVFEFLPAKVSEAIVQLSAEANYFAAMLNQRDRGAKGPSPAKFADFVAKRERKFIIARLPKAQRDSSKTNPAWRNPSTLKQYATLVGSRKLLVRSIKQVHAEYSGASGWTEYLDENSDFQMLRTGVSKPVLNWAIKRAADDGLSKREREPLSIACEMARQELNLDKQELQTLRNYYTKGAGLLKQDRSQRKPAQ